MNLLRTATTKLYNKVVSPSNEEEDDEDKNKGPLDEALSSGAGRSGGGGGVASSLSSSSSFMMRNKFERKKSALIFNEKKPSSVAKEDEDVKDVMFDERLANELMLSKLWKEVEVKANDGDAATTRDAFLRLLVADARKRWDAKKIVDKVETPSGIIAVGVGRCGHPRKV